MTICTRMCTSAMFFVTRLSTLVCTAASAGRETRLSRPISIIIPCHASSLILHSAAFYYCRTGDHIRDCLSLGVKIASAVNVLICYCYWPNGTMNKPHSLKGTSNATLQCTQHIHASFADKSRETNVKPVDNVATMHDDEVDKRVDEHRKDFGVRIMKHSREHLSDALQLHRAYEQTHSRPLSDILFQFYSNITIRFNGYFSR